mmetsp:Transcript_17886/g.40924  ORF Transcript_17886/g.40924 Transcript_17886/m.40924 type:complete len:251 (+) Transcript_17886:41-793(+)
MNFHCRRPTKLILIGTPEELASFTVRKLVTINTHCTNLPIICEEATFEECRRLSHLAKSLVLVVEFSNHANDGGENITVATSRTMMKYIASVGMKSRDHAVNPHSALVGTSVAEEAMIDCWLSFIWKSIDLPLQALLSLLKNDVPNATRQAEIEGIEKGISISLKKIERHLSNQQSPSPGSDDYRPLAIVAATNGATNDSPYTLADLSLAITLRHMLDKNIGVHALTSEENPRLCRWKELIHTALGLSRD